MMPTRGVGARGLRAVGEALALLLLSPLAISFTTHTPRWDELFFFHHAACLRDALQIMSWPMADGCMASMTKSPLLALMLLPSTPLHGPESLVVAPIMLSLLSFGLLWLAIRLAQRGGVPLLLTIAAAGVAILATPLSDGAPFLGDEVAAIIVLDTLLLLPLESAEPAERSNATALRRGLLWGLVCSIGVLIKLTYLYFAGVTFGALVLLSWWLCGWRVTAMKLLGMALVGVLPAAVYARYGSVYWGWAISAAFGPIAALYNDHIQRWVYLTDTLHTLGALYWLGLCALLVVAGLIAWRSGQRRPVLVCAALVAIVAGYLFIASGSPNKDPRFFWPVWLALPFCIAAAASQVSDQTSTAMRGMGVLPAGLIVLLSVMTSGRFNMRAVTEADLVLHGIPHDHPATVLLAMDEGAFNIETFILARQMDFSALHNITVGTVVYDFVSKMTVAASIDRLMQADYVVLRDPVDGTAPAWANQFLPRFAAAVAAKGRLVRSFPGREETRVYAMH